MVRPILAFLLAFSLWCGTACAQPANHMLVGYWHNWNDMNAPYIPLSQVDERYDVIALSFAIPVSASDMTMQFVPDGTTPAVLQTEIAALKAQGKKVVISVGGATASVSLDTEDQKNDFVQSMSDIISQYGFNGLDIDIEYGSTILAAGGTISNPTSASQLNLIEAVKEIMEHYHIENGEKLFLTFAPETAYVQGGQSGYGGIWGGYLPLLDALRDSIDILQVQLYNSGTMFGIDGVVYEQGNADFIVAMTEAVIQGFQTAGGFFEGFPAEKVAVGLPACELAAGGGYVEPDEVIQAMHYLLGNGPQPGSYALAQPDAYADLKGMMTWSINWDAVQSCAGDHSFAETYEEIFGLVTGLEEDQVHAWKLFPNPAREVLYLEGISSGEPVQVLDMMGRHLAQQVMFHGEALDISALPVGTYVLRAGLQSRLFVKE
ncbi:MAG: T9SS C-terminal target domain-containing protein [Cryomorphaceae bacterium]|nr:MAG: T9SS C-terminal target domain-containing protein [Cryomorphaceae bacterium]